MKRKHIMNILRLADPCRAAEGLPQKDLDHLVEVVEEMRDIVSKFKPVHGYDPLDDLAGAYQE